MKERVTAFVRKPDRVTADRYSPSPASGGILWLC